MNGNKGFLIVIIAILVLSLVAGGLATALVFQCVNAAQDYTKDRWDDRDDRWDNDDHDWDWAVEEAPMETIPPMEEAVEVPAFMEMGDFKVALITADEGTDNVRMADAFAEACESMGVPYDFYLNSSGTSEEQFERALVLMESGEVQALAVTNMDPDMAMELSNIALDLGVVLITIDLAADVLPAENALLHINTWGSGDDVAMQLLLTMADMTDRKGKFGVVTGDESSPIYDAMERYIGIFDELENTVWKASGTGEGTEKSVEESVLYMLDRYDLDAIITTDPMATAVAARVIAENGYDVKLIGFGYPSDVQPYLNEGVVLCVDPRATGQLAAHSLVGIMTGELTPKAGEWVALNNGWEYQIEMADEGVLMLFPGPVFADTNTVYEYAQWY